MTERQFTHLRWATFGLLAGALLVLFRPAIQFSVSMFQDPHEDLKHGWFIPVLSGCVIWRMRAELAAAARRPDWRGVLALAACLALFWLGSRGEQARLMQVGMIACVVAVPLLFWGPAVARRLLFPAAYLLFILPTSFLDMLTFRLRFVAAWLATGVLNGLGVAVRQVGTAMVSIDPNGFKLDVADPCSGMRSIFAMAALTAAYAYFTQRTRLRKWLLFSCALPLAVLGNILRLVLTGLVAAHFGQAAGVRYHDSLIGGSVGFVAAVLLMMAAASWVRRIGPDPVTRAETAPSPAPVPARVGHLLPLFPGLLLAGLCLTATLLAPAPLMEPDNLIGAAQPGQVGTFSGHTPLFCQNPQCLASFSDRDAAVSSNTCPRCGKPLDRISLGEKTWLPSDTRILKRVYTRGDGRVLSLTVVVSGRSRLSIHRPEMCLPGQGFNILSRSVRVFDLGGGRTLRANQVQAGRSGENPIRFLYWFVSAHGETPSHWKRIFTDVWDRSVHNRMNRWCMITLFDGGALDDPEWIRTQASFLAEWYPQMLQTSPKR